MIKLTKILASTIIYIRTNYSHFNLIFRNKQILLNHYAI